MFTGSYQSMITYFVRTSCATRTYLKAFLMSGCRNLSRRTKACLSVMVIPTLLYTVTAAAEGDLAPPEFILEGNRATIDQLGQEHKALIEQSGNANDAHIVQIDRDNRAEIIQIGYGNEAKVRQDGVGLHAKILQEGDRNLVDIVQPEAGADITVKQVGNDMNFRIRPQ